MRKAVKVLCFVLVMLMMVSLLGCGNDKSPYKKRPVTAQQELQEYIGTWRGSDHDGEKVVHYLIFDENGYWNVYMNYESLVAAIKQLPDQLVSFKVFTQLQKSGQTGCYYEYVENYGGINYADYFSIDEQGHLKESIETDVYYTLVSTDSGSPAESVIAEARLLFDHAREKALS